MKIPVFQVLRRLFAVITLCMLIVGCASPGGDARTNHSGAQTSEALRRRSHLPSLQAKLSLSSLVPASKRGIIYLMKPGDRIVVSLSSIPKPDSIEDIIDEDGYISLPYINRVKAAGKTGSELERDIREKYLESKIYKDITINVNVPTRSYFVRGEVLRPGRFQLTSGMTMVQAMAAAGGYTEYANPRKVKVLRGDNFFFVDIKELERHPEKDKDVEVGDVLVVPRSVF